MDNKYPKYNIDDQVIKNLNLISKDYGSKSYGPTVSVPFPNTYSTAYSQPIMLDSKFNDYLGSKTTKTDSGLVLPELVWYIGTGKKGFFKDTLAKAKVSVSAYRPDQSVVVVQFDLLTGNRNVLMDYVPPDRCQGCDNVFTFRYSRMERYIDPLAPTLFEGIILCKSCYEANSAIKTLRRRR